MGICGIVNRLNLDLKRLRFYRVGNSFVYLVPKGRVLRRKLSEWNLVGPYYWDSNRRIMRRTCVGGMAGPSYEGLDC